MRKICIAPGCQIEKDAYKGLQKNNLRLSKRSVDPAIGAQWNALEVCYSIGVAPADGTGEICG